MASYEHCLGIFTQCHCYLSSDPVTKMLKELHKFGSILGRKGGKVKLELPVQIHDLWVQIHELRVQIHELRV